MRSELKVGISWFVLSCQEIQFYHVAMVTREELHQRAPGVKACSVCEGWGLQGACDRERWQLRGQQLGGL